ncbi:MAG TPA: D-aminoacylase [Gemmatimonadota bacterium]|nr:D-aminoacylase [Gemmatimonadota bacterium]
MVLAHGRVVDGTGAPWFEGDVGIRGDRIAFVGPAGSLDDAAADRRIDARGLVVAPGFIDIQGQSQGAFLDGDGRVVSKTTQGVTTSILGEGWTAAPENQKIRSLRDLSDPHDDAPEHDFSGPHAFDAWLRAMHAHGTSPNVGSFLGAATVRTYAMGGARGAPDAAALDTMEAVARRAMEDGAFGLASALIYPPGSFATTDELAAVAGAMAPYGGVYITHMRSEGDHLLDALDEAMEIGRRAGVPVEIYHLKAAGRRNWPRMDTVIARIDSARAAGQDVQADMYPYTAGATGLAAVLPPWASEGGKLLERLRDPEQRRKIHDAVLQPSTEWENLGQLAGPEGVLVLGLEKEGNAKWEGKRLSEIAGARGVDWVDAAIDLIVSEEGRVPTAYFLMSEDNVRRQMRLPWIKWGTDAAGLDPDSAQGLTHPRSYGTYPRILGRYVRDQHVLGLEEAVRKATSAVADRLYLQDRGILREGAYADVVVFDPGTILDRATYREPHRLSTGVEQVFVNGVAVVRDGAPTGATPGRVVRGRGYRR